MSSICRSVENTKAKLWLGWNLKSVQPAFICCAEWLWANAEESGWGKKGSEELLCVSQALKSFMKQISILIRSYFFFTALELLMYSWASPHRHGYECLSSHACRRKDGGRCRVSLAGVAQSGVEPQWCGLLVCPQVLARNRGGLKYGESSQPAYREQEIKLSFSWISLPVFT